MIQIGEFKIFPPVFSAPMAGYSHRAMRELYRSFGVGMNCAPLISVHSVLQSGEELIDISPEEVPVSLQLYGGEPKLFFQACQKIRRRYPFVIFDLNMGCAVKKIHKKGAGVALMADEKHAFEVMSAMVEGAFPSPVIVKMRSGPCAEKINFKSIALLAQKAGVSAVVLHPRSREGGLTSFCDWSQIRSLKESLKIPVIGNGQIENAKMALEMFEKTGCDGVMIGRAAWGNPFIFSEIANRLKKENQKEITRSDRIHAALMLIGLEEKYSTQKEILYLRLRKILPLFFSGESDFEWVRQKVVSARSMEALKEICYIAQQRTLADVGRRDFP